MDVLGLTIAKRKAIKSAQLVNKTTTVNDSVTGWPYLVVVENGNIGVKQINPLVSVEFTNPISSELYKGDRFYVYVKAISEEGDDITSSSLITYESENELHFTVNEQGRIIVLEDGSSKLFVHVDYKGRRITKEALINSDLTDEQAILYTIQTLSLDTVLNSTVEDFELPIDGKNGSILSWYSSDTETINIVNTIEESNEGHVLRAINELSVYTNLSATEEHFKLSTTSLNCEVQWVSSDENVIAIMNDTESEEDDVLKSLEDVYIHVDPENVTEDFLLLQNVNNCTVDWSTSDDTVIKISTKEESDAHRVQMALDDVFIWSNLDNATEDIKLMTKSNDCHVNWESSDNSIIRITTEKIADAYHVTNELSNLAIYTDLDNITDDFRLTKDLSRCELVWSSSDESVIIITTEEEANISHVNNSIESLHIYRNNLDAVETDFNLQATEGVCDVEWTSSDNSIIKIITPE